MREDLEPIQKYVELRAWQLRRLVVLTPLAELLIDNWRDAEFVRRTHLRKFEKKPEPRLADLLDVWTTRTENLLSKISRLERVARQPQDQLRQDPEVEHHLTEMRQADEYSAALPPPEPPPAPEPEPIRLEDTDAFYGPPEDRRPRPTGPGEA